MPQPMSHPCSRNNARYDAGRRCVVSKPLCHRLAPRRYIIGYDINAFQGNFSHGQFAFRKTRPFYDYRNLCGYMGTHCSAGPAAAGCISDFRNCYSHLMLWLHCHFKTMHTWDPQIYFCIRPRNVLNQPRLTGLSLPHWTEAAGTPLCPLLPGSSAGRTDATAGAVPCTHVHLQRCFTIIFSVVSSNLPPDSAVATLQLYRVGYFGAVVFELIMSVETLWLHMNFRGTPVELKCTFWCRSHIKLL